MTIAKATRLVAKTASEVTFSPRTSAKKAARRAVRRSARALIEEELD